MKYDYKEAVKRDIRDYIKCNSADPDNLDRDCLYDDMFCDDSVTGNGCGSYTCDTEKARGYVNGNESLVKKAVTEFCCTPETIAEHMFDWEWLDVTVRCHLLGECLDEVLDEIRENGWPD